MNELIPAYFGHHKCGSTWIMTVLSQVCRHIGINTNYYYSPKSWGYNGKNKYTLDKVINDLHIDFVGYTSADLRYVGDISKYRGVHIIRDPRDIVTSSYFSHLHSHPSEGWPELDIFRDKISNLSKSEGFMSNIDFTAKLPLDGFDLDLFKSMEEWNYKNSNILELKYEDIIINPYKSFIKIFDHFDITANVSLNINNIVNHILIEASQKILRLVNHKISNVKLPEWFILYIVYKNDFSNITNRSIGEENIKSHLRKGLSGDWKNHFNEDHIKYFKNNYNDILVKLGYENDDKW
jgi:hypothetical protein